MSAEPLRDRNVLIVEDHYLIARELGRQVRQLGGTVIATLSRSDDALELLRRERPDLVLLDVNLDGQRSYPVADALLKAGIPFVFTTGYDRSALEPRFDAVPYLEKPVTGPALAALLAEVLAVVPSPGTG